MSNQDKREYKIRLFTIKHLEQKFCDLKDKKYFNLIILENNIQEALLD